MIKHIDVEELDRVEEAVVIDVREPEEFKRGSLPEARNVPLSDFLDKCEDGSLGVGKREMMIIHCKSGSRSLIAAEAAKKAGFTKAYHLRGGFDAWKKFSRSQ